jgi:predicted transporter
MNANIIMWTGGMLAVLGAFAFKLGAGFHAGRLRARWIAMLVTGYLGLFTLAGFFSGALAKGLELLGRKGPYPHMAFAGGMMLWGLWLAGRKRRVLKEPGRVGPANTRVLALILPCPVSLGAAAFSVCAAVVVLALPPLFAQQRPLALP